MPTNKNKQTSSNIGLNNDNDDKRFDSFLHLAGKNCDVVAYN